MLKAISNWFSATETAMLQTLSEEFQNAFKKTASLSYTMQERPQLHKLIYLHLYVFHRTLKSCSIFGQSETTYFIMVVPTLLTSLRKSRMNFWHKTNRLFTHIEFIWFRTTQKKFFFYFYPHFDSNKDQNPVTTLDSDTSDIIHNDLNTSYNKTELNINTFDTFHSVIILMMHDLYLMKT